MVKGLIESFDGRMAWFVRIARMTAYGKNIYLPADPLHFTAQGNAIVAERLFETFTNILIK